MRVKPEIFAGSERQFSHARPVLAEVFFGHSQHVLRLCFGVVVAAGHYFFVLNLETLGFYAVEELSDFGENQVAGLSIVSSQGTLNCCGFADDVEAFSGLQHGKSTRKRSFLFFQLANILLNLRIKFHGLPYSNLQPFRRAPVSPIPNNHNFQDRYLTHDGAFFAPNIAQPTHGPVMKPVDFVDALEATFFDHELCAVERTLL